MARACRRRWRDIRRRAEWRGDNEGINRQSCSSHSECRKRLPAYALRTWRLDCRPSLLVGAWRTLCLGRIAEEVPCGRRIGAWRMRWLTWHLVRLAAADRLKNYRDGFA